MDKRIIFKISVAVLLPFSSTLIWWIVGSVLQQYPLTSQATVFSLIIFLLSLFCYLSLFCLVATFFGKPFLIFAMAAVGCLPLFLVVPQILPFIATVFLFSLLQGFAMLRLKSRLTLFTKIKIGEIYSSFLKFTFILFSALLCVSFYFFYVPRVPERVYLPERAFETIIERMLSLFGRGLQLPTEGDPQQNLDWLVQESREENVGERIPEHILFLLGGRSVSPESLRDFLSQQQANGGLQLGISELRSQLEDELNSVLAPYLRFFPMIFATSLFLILRLSASLIVFMAVCFLNVVIKVLKKTGLVEVFTETVEAERMRI